MAVEAEARFRVLTPLFCVGSSPDRPELRLPSFKGVLRFWWRALAWPRLDGDLGRIQRAEDALFGSSGGVQSHLSMRLPAFPEPKSGRPPETLKDPGGTVVGEGSRYLGYGVMEAFNSRGKNTRAGQLTRACLLPPFEFTVRFRARSLSDDERSSLRDALFALGTLGGIGSKSRKGYGSLCLERLSMDGEEEWTAPQSAGDLAKSIGASLRTGASDDRLPEYTALSRSARHVVLSSGEREPLRVLDLVGRELIRFRSWGHRGKILGNEDSERRFSDDHDMMKGGGAATHPRRVAFGLPHNYGQDGQVGPSRPGLDRRASPLFIHIHQCGESPVAVVSFLPARFLPEGRSEISVGGSKVPQRPEQELYQPIHEFLDRLLDPGQRREPFTGAAEVS